MLKLQTPEQNKFRKKEFPRKGVIISIECFLIPPWFFSLSPVDVQLPGRVRANGPAETGFTRGRGRWKVEGYEQPYQHKVQIQLIGKRILKRIRPAHAP